MGCQLLCVASDAPLPFEEWGYPTNHIHVGGPYDATAQEFGRIFSKPFAYRIGTVETGGCACGFQYDTLASQKARDRLIAFLERALTWVNELELFAPTTDRELLPTASDWIVASDISWRGPFRQFEFLRVVRDD
jgi:hypothetical protein